MFMRYIHMTVQNFKAQSVAVVVEISERSNCVKLPDTDSSCLMNPSEHPVFSHTSSSPPITTFVPHPLDINGEDAQRHHRPH